MSFAQKCDYEREEEISELGAIQSIQRQLDDLQARLSNDRSPQNLDDHRLARLVKEILRSRRRREKVFGADLFGEPTWDILLELFAAELTQQRLSVSSACYASAVPPTTALRWISRLERQGWVERSPDRIDRRRFWLRLTDRASSELRSYFDQIAVRVSQECPAPA
jgi:DNA-binding MarR family transcriptional regulator